MDKNQTTRDCKFAKVTSHTNTHFYETTYVKKLFWYNFEILSFQLKKRFECWCLCFELARRQKYVIFVDQTQPACHPATQNLSLT